MTQLTVSLIGPFHSTLNGQPVTGFESNKVRALLVYLVVENGRPHSRQTLAGLLWPDYPESSALANLRHALANLRQVLDNERADPPYLAITRELVQLNPASSIEVDLASFESQIRSAQTYPNNASSTQQFSTPTPDADAKINLLKSAISLFRAPFLEGFVCDSPAFEEWAQVRRERADRQVREALELLARRLGETGEHEQSVQYARRLLELEPWDEAAHRLVMQGLSQSGQRSAALAQFETCRRVLKQELDVEPAVETMSLYESIRKSGLGPISSATPLQKEVEAAPRPNLPRPLTSFVGREGELAEVRRLLGFPVPGSSVPKEMIRLLTLSGPGGCGKTRLAIAAVRSLDETGGYRDGARWVDFTSLSDPALVPQTVAAALGLSESAGGSGLTNYLREKELLLVLDNTEHLIEACAHLAEDLLNECPDLVILATSREPLGIPGERVWRVPSLSTPEPQAASQLSMDDLLGHDAVRLFCERAETASPGWRLSGSETVVAAICRRLDGIPLAIELAAARVRMMAVEQIEARLQDAFSLLSGGSRTALPRHQTLHSCIDWSYNLLSTDKRILLQRLSIFAGGWTLEAAESVCGGDEEGDLRPTQILDLLGQLVDRSLVVVEQSQDKHVRYRLLETIRQYARGKLVEMEGEEAVRERHLAHFLALAERIEPELRSRENLDRLNQTKKELNNLRLALGFALETDLEAELRLASALMGFRMPYMRWDEGAAWLEQGLARSEAEGISLKVRSKALAASGRTLSYTNLNKSNERIKESLQLCRNLGEAGKRGAALALGYLGSNETYAGKYSQADTYLQEALSIYQEISDPINLCSCLGFLSENLWQIENGSQAARQRAEECLSLQYELGDLDGIALLNAGLGDMAIGELDLARAKPYFEQSLSIHQQLGEMDYILKPIIGLGNIAFLEGDYTLAQRYFQGAVDIQHAGGSQFIYYALIPLGDLYLVSGKNELALQCYNEAKTVVEKSDSIFFIGWAQHRLATLAWLMGDYNRAQELFAKALVHFRTESSLTIPITCQIRWGSLLCQGGDPLEAASWLMEGIRYFGQTRNWVEMAVGVDGLARLAAGSQPERAARLFGAAAHMHPYLPNLLYPLERDGREAALALAKAALGAEAFAEAWEEGQAMSMEEVILAQ